MTISEDTAARTIWDYMRLNQVIGDAECLLAIGSLRDDVALYAAGLIDSFEYQTIIISGGNSRASLTRKLGWGDDTEAMHFLKLMQASGCTRSDILLEQAAANTGENAALSAAMLKKLHIKPSSVLVVTKPYMERRVMATFEIQWPTPRPTIQVTSPQLDFNEYCESHDDREHTVNIMVGDLQRIMEYPKLGLQSEQHVPAHVRSAYEELLAAGYTKHLIQSM